MYVVLFGLLNLELEAIPSGQKNIQQWTFKFPGKEFNVTDITGQQFL